MGHLQRRVQTTLWTGATGVPRTGGRGSPPPRQMVSDTEQKAGEGGRLSRFKIRSKRFCRVRGTSLGARPMPWARIRVPLMTARKKSLAVNLPFALACHGLCPLPRAAGTCPPGPQASSFRWYPGPATSPALSDLLWKSSRQTAGSLKLLLRFQQYQKCPDILETPKIAHW